MKKMYLPENVKYIISALNSKGYRADAVGGCVRDFLLGKTPFDYDITTNATPDEMKRVFSDEHVIETGIKHGTLTLILNGEPYEITTYRLDGEYSDNRRPDSVYFTRELAEDLARRDFTVNAMCYNDDEGYTDLFSGMSDLKACVIRAVGDAEVRFSEDALRIMRAIRFASVLNFKIDKSTALAVHKLKELLKNVSYERICIEWRKLVGGVNAYKIISEYKDVILEIIPELSCLRLPEEKRFGEASGDIRELSLFAMADRYNASKLFASAMDRMKSDGAHKKIGMSVLENIDKKIEIKIDIKLLLMKLGESATQKLLALKVLLGDAESFVIEELNQILEDGEPYRLSELKINGNDIKALGISGEAVGKTLEKLLIKVICGEVRNEREALLSAVTKEA